ncbi:DUF421 domain-containing protein [Amycolatopsis thermophila]|uniref:Uncharacterized membrane protein YcaP (DUF421 family) n=1 Tax=Amycolatopsis thermophila TaxID=206084 RepID=A0ABU0F5R1_9PSEU|nr:YetF domain-containing protein [Amycolatopsis thermophila]MDQ0382923.1 uncharacterized membrane protein YcaP (DUF421 family) [Amycolatopsis thermophila]
MPATSGADWLIGGGSELPATCLKTVTLSLTALAGLRLAPRRALAELRIFDLVVIIATGAIVGRTATAPDGSFLVGAAALVTLLAVHIVISRLRFVPRVASVLDHPVRVLVVDGAVDHRQLKAAQLTEGDLYEALRERGVHNLGGIRYVLYESKGGLTVVNDDEATSDAGTTLPDV